MTRRFGFTGPVFGNGMNNKKETAGRSYRKQRVPRYSKKELERMANEGMPPVELAAKARQMKVVLHER